MNCPKLQAGSVACKPSNRNSRIDTPAVQVAVNALGQHLEVLTAGTESELDSAFAAMARQQIDALVGEGGPILHLSARTTSCVGSPLRGALRFTHLQRLLRSAV